MSESNILSIKDDVAPKSHTTILAVKSWEEFLNVAEGFDEPNGVPWDEVWFRGQADAQWPLHTSLERRSERTRTVVSYLRLISEIRPIIETFTGGGFAIPLLPELEQICRKYDLFDQHLRKLATYLAHLRHGGFPSPLLDWTASPYVAAYFAFHNARHDGEVAIYAYREWAQKFKTYGAHDPHIVSFGPLFKTHERHFRQQSRYTACVEWGDDEQWYFKPHDAVLGQTDRYHQDLLWKISIPASERLKVLRFCDKVNLNAFTLFNSEEGLLEMQAMRVFDLRT
jgi:hypothetical protein